MGHALWAGTTFVIAPIPNKAGQEIAGTYNHTRNIITISDTFFAKSTQEVVEAMLVHELTHVLPDLEEWRGLSAEERCLRREFAAEYMVGYWWHMKYAYRGSTSTDPMVPHFNHLAVLIRDRALYGNLNRLARYVQDRFSAVCAAAVAGKVQ